MAEARPKRQAVRDLQRGLLDYTTDIPVDRTVDEIQRLLRGAGARRINVDFDEAGQPSASVNVNNPPPTNSTAPRRAKTA